MSENIEFGIDSNLESSRDAQFPKGGIYGGYLTKVAYEEIPKKDNPDIKFDTLSFYFTDVEGRKYKHTEWAVKSDDADARVKAVKAQNIKIKHIFEAFQPVPTEGLGKGAKDWKEFFSKIAEQFNTGKGGKAIFEMDNSGKMVCIPVWFKLTYYRDNLGFPYSPNFIERNMGKASLLTINPTYDTIEYQKKNNENLASGLPGAQSGIPGTSDTFIF